MRRHSMIYDKPSDAKFRCYMITTTFAGTVGTKNSVNMFELKQNKTTQKSKKTISFYNTVLNNFL